MRRLAVLVCTLALVVGAAGAVEAAPAPARYARAAHVATNANRAAEGLAPLRKTDCLRKFAVRQAKRMAQREQMFHQDLGPVMAACKLNTAGENVAYGYPTGRSVVNDGWMHSAGHRANILSRDFRIMAVGARKGHDGRWYVAQVFGRKASPRVAATPRRAPGVTLEVNEAGPSSRQKITFSGRVHPWAQGERLTLQVRPEGAARWKALRTVRLSHRDFEITDKVRKAGIRRYRVLAHPAGQDVVTSQQVKVTVYRTVSLTYLEPIASRTMAEVPSVSMYGLTYLDSLATSGDGTHYLDYDLRGRCTELNVTPGLESHSKPEGQGGWSIDGDGAPVEHVTNFYMVSGVRTLRFNAQTTGGAIVGFGSPVGRCAF